MARGSILLDCDVGACKIGILAALCRVQPSKREGGKKGDRVTTSKMKWYRDLRGQFIILLFFF